MRILFICMGNICRSPSAEGVLRSRAASRAAELRLDVDSAGTHDYHIGAAPDRRAQAAALRRGIDISQLRARQVSAEDFASFDLILAMDDANLGELQRYASATQRARVKLFMDYAPALQRRAVPDPYYGDERGFEDVLDLLEAAADGLLDELLSTR